MYYVSKQMEIAGAHRLDLPYESKCKNLHGHNWLVTVKCKSETLNENGMVYDFTHIKRDVHDKLDHTFINDVVGVNPTAENIAHWICEQIGDTCYEVSVQESSGNVAVYRPDGE